MALTLNNIHPGEILNEEFLKPFKLSQTRLARDIQVSPRRINEIVTGKRSITAETALKLSTYFGISENFWMGLQDDYELEAARIRLGEHLKTIVPLQVQTAKLTQSNTMDGQI